MTLEFVLVLIASILTLVVLIVGIAALRSWMTKMPFVVLGLLLLTVNLSWLVGRALQSPGIDALSVSSTILVFPTTTILVMTFFHGRRFTRKVYLPLMVLAPSLGIILVSRTEGWASSDLYDHSLFTLYAIACLGISIGESSSHWLRSHILREEGYLFVLSLLVLLTTGLIYRRMEILNANSFVGPSLGLLLFAAIALMALLRANYAPVRLPSRRSSPEGMSRFDLEAGRIHFISETRPKYSVTIFADIVRNGKPGLILTSSSRYTFEERHCVSKAAIVRISFHGEQGCIRPSDLSRLYFSVRDFALSQRQGVVLLDAFPRIVCNNEIQAVRELTIHMRHLARSTGCTFIVPKSLITDIEFSRIVGPKDMVMEFPDVEKRTLQILDAHIGKLCQYLLHAYCKRKDIAMKDFLLEDIPGLATWMTSTLDTLGVYAGDNAVLRNWGHESQRISADLLGYYNSDLGEAQQLSVNPPVISGSPFSQVVFNGKEGLPVFGKGKVRPRKELDTRERLLRIFAKYLGKAGRYVLAKEIEKLGKSLNEVTLADVADIAERAQEVMIEFGEIVDVNEIKVDMKLRGYIMKEEIIGIMSEGV